MSLKKSLALLENKSYQPVYSGNVNNNKYLASALAQQQKTLRPKTGLTSKSFSAFASRPTTSLTSFSGNRSVTSTSRRLKSSVSVDTRKSQENEALPLDLNDYDAKSQASTNISLFSMAASERTIPKMRAYNQFNYNSYFERYLNRRAPVKILYMPPQRTSDEPVLEPSLYEVLDKDELDQIFGMHDVLVAIPCRIRSISISNEQPSKRNEKMINTFKKFKQPGLKAKNTRSNSLEPLSILKQRLKAHAKPEESSGVETKVERQSVDFVSARGISYPKIDFFNTKLKDPMPVRAKTAKLTKRDFLYSKNNQYSHVKSRLGNYLSSNSSITRTKSNTLAGNSKNNTRRTKSAIETFYFTSAAYLQYTKSNQIDVNSYLKLSKELENMVRSDRKPVYFGELIQENINAHNKGQSFGLYNKFYNISEWLKTMNQKDCAHFYSNPFTSEKFTDTDDLEQGEEENLPTQESNPMSIRPHTSVVHRSSESTMSEPSIKSPFPIRMFATSKYKIDPFQNPKNVLLKSRALAQKLEINHPNNNVEYRESVEKQTLVAQKEYTQLLSVKKRFALSGAGDSLTKMKTDQSHDSKPGIRNYQSESNLAKQKALNDLILTRMELGLFIF